MLRRLHIAVSRVLLVVALFTFLSPTLGLQLTATHEQLEHHYLALGVPDHDAHDHSGEDDAAHGMIGHVLTHMPVHIAAAVGVVAPDAVFSRFFSAPLPLQGTVPEPPFIPPRFLAA